MKFNEAKKIEDFIKRVERDINDFWEIAGTEAINHTTRNFQKQGFDDNGVTPWKNRKRERIRDRGRAILVKSGALRRSFIKRKAGRLAVYIISPLPYANRHNEGLKGMPKRQIVGDSRKLNAKILRQLDKRIKRSFG